MKFHWLKQLMPRGLYGRGALILLLPIVTIQLVVSVVFIQRHFERVTEQMTGSMLLEIDLMIDTVDDAVDLGEAQTKLSALGKPLQIRTDLPAVLDETRGDHRRFYDLTGLVVMDVLHQLVRPVQAIDLTDGDRVVLWVMTDKGLMKIDFARGRASASNPHQLLVLMMVVGLLMSVIAYLFLRNQLKPIRHLSMMAEAFGRVQSVPYRISGATEVRSAGAAFLDMRNRIERHIEQRTMMLSAISHDLRTPLTRLRLGLSMLPRNEEDAKDIEDMEMDVAEMGRLIDAFLEFSRNQAQASAPDDTDIGALVRDAVQYAQRSGKPVILGNCPPDGEVIVKLRSEAIRRALDNLIGNALRYGGQAEVTVTLGGKVLKISVEDPGPGIPPERREEALRPFTRLDPARNQDLGQGVGLGLSIASDIVRAHGGSLNLRKSESLGGLQAEIVLPL
ncbi:ATP-binding protein [Thioclava sp. GXIMD2076]|uniref:ATP-binding protein n=1 Tax=Thioclava sp. GXIMD2076 TaxID=3131931 RepID=UPI0030D301B7